MPKKKNIKLKSDKNVAMEEVYLTKEGFKKLEDELADLLGNRRKEVAEKIKVAIALGDLSENAEYEEAKNEQAFIEGRIIELEILIKNAKIFTEKKGKAGSKVQIGNTVELFNEKTKETEIYTIVGSIETDPLNNKISNESPVGSLVIDSSVGEKLEIKTPGGEVTYTIKKIK